MAKVIEDFISTTLGGREKAAKVHSQREFQEEVLAHVEYRLTAEEKLYLNSPITLDELEEAVKVLKKTQMPWPRRRLC